MKKVMLVFGTRPEAIKMCPLVKEFQKRSEEMETIVCVTGQHREMLDQVLKIFDVKPDIDLNIMKQGQDLTDVTVRILSGMRDVFKTCRPDVVLVHGDTTTSTAAALAAFYAQIPVGHVEAGLRTRNIYSPWPEEMNRQMTGRIATYNFSPTPLSAENLREEKVQGNIYVTGNTVIDALHMVVEKLKRDEALAREQDKVLLEAGYDVTRLANGKKLVLITGHRRENFGDGFIRMLPGMTAKVLEQNDKIENIAKTFTYAHNFMYLGRGWNYPVALEGALKLKEISYIHAEGYPAAEMKHGPIALIDAEMPVLFLATHHQQYQKIVSNMEEVKARGGRIIAVVTEGDEQVKEIADQVIEVPQTENFLAPLLSVIPLQLLAYHIAVKKGKNVDMPRNLAKSVTVE